MSFFLWGKKQIIENNHLNIKRRDGKAKQQREEEEKKGQTICECMLFYISATRHRLQTLAAGYNGIKRLLFSIIYDSRVTVNTIPG